MDYIKVLGMNSNVTNYIPISPMVKWLEAEVDDAVEGDIHLSFTVTPKLANPAKFLHGGIQCAVLDEAIGMAGATLGHKQFLYAIDLKIDYMRPAPIGQKLTVRAQVIRQGKNIFNCTGEIRTEEGKIISQARSNLIKKPNC
jgi:acyl-CoA thioesterase